MAGNSAKRYALIVAGGIGKRMGSDIPKQFMLLDKRPILMHTIERFATLPVPPRIVVVLPSEQIRQWEKLCQEYGFSTKHRIVSGGATRFESVNNGLQLVPSDSSLVAIHDGVRPFIPHSLIERCYQLAEQKGTAVPVIHPIESVRLLSGKTSRQFPRNQTFLVQTPQVFKAKLIKRSYRIPFSDEFTDDASVAENAGIPITLTEGTRENIKITTPFDLIIANQLIEQYRKTL